MSQPSDTMPLDTSTIAALRDEVAAAKARGWLQSDFKRFFAGKGVPPEAYFAAMAGSDVAAEIHATLVQISILAIPTYPYEPNPDDIRRHIEWLVEPARGSFDDGLIEIAYDGQGRGPSKAALFGIDEIEAAVEFAVARNKEWRNVYIGAALKLPDTDRAVRANGADFYVATAVPIDIDTDYDATRARMAEVCDDGLVITTGLTPQRRSQHWSRLAQPCDDEADFGHAFAALVMNTGADMKVKDSARIMRLGGTVSFPRDPKKLEAGYCTELTSVFVNPTARLSDLDRLKGLDPAAAPGDRFDASSRPKNTEIERDWTGRVIDGRESHFRDLLLKHLRRHQEENGADPSPEDLFDEAFADFCDPAKTDNKDGRWTGTEGQRELRGRAQNTIRRLRAGRLASRGLYSIDTEVGRGEAEAVRANREATFRPAQPSVRATDDNLFEVLTISDIKSLPETDWIVEDVIPRDGLGFVYGAPGSYKSFVCYDLALALAYGHTSWLSHPVKHTGSVLYLASEGATGARNRITAWQRKNGVESDDGAFRLIRTSLSFMRPEDVDKLERTVAAVVAEHGPVDTVFVDTVSRVLPGADENLQKDMTLFVAACDRLREQFGATVVGVHHTNKNGDMRGSTVFLGQGDFVLRLDKDEQAKGGVLTCEKQKEAEDGWKVAFEVETQAWTAPGRIKETSSLTVKWTGKPDDTAPKLKWPPRDVLRAFQRSISAAFMKGEPLSLAHQTKTDGRYAPTRIAAAHDVPGPVVFEVLNTWLEQGVLEVQQASSKTKIRGLQVAKWLD